MDEIIICLLNFIIKKKEFIGKYEEDLTYQDLGKSQIYFNDNTYNSTFE
jgi:hypothetical protein